MHRIIHIIIALIIGVMLARWDISSSDHGARAVLILGVTILITGVMGVNMVMQVRQGKLDQQARKQRRARKLA